MARSMLMRLGLVHADTSRPEAGGTASEPIAPCMVAFIKGDRFPRSRRQG